MQSKILFIAFLFCTVVYSQTSTTSISLQDAIQYGLKNRYDVQSTNVQSRIVKNEWNKFKYQWLPTLNGTGTIRYNTQLATTILPAGAFGNPNPTEVQFGTRNNTTLAVDFEQTIIKPTIFSDTRLGKIQYDQQNVRTQLKEKDVIKAISLAYYDALLKKKQWDLSEETAKNLKELMDIAKSKLDLGAIKENDYLKQKLDFQTADQKRIQNKQNYDLALEQLKKEMNFTESSSLELTENLVDKKNITLNTDTSFSFNSDIQILQMQNEYYRVSKKRGILNSIPSLSFFANYTLQFQRDNFDYGQTWYPFNFIGIRLNVPIFNQWKNQATIKEFKLKSEQNLFDINYKKQNLQFELKKAETELNNASDNVAISESNYDLATLIYNKDMEQFKLGNISYSDLLLSSKTRIDAEQNLILSWSAYHNARINYENITR